MTRASPRSTQRYLLVHGLGLGGWIWSRVARRLRAQGHDVFTPSLTGLAERSHLSGPRIDLDTHVTDVVNVLHWESLEDVVLAGHSYGGSVVTGAADRVPERIRHLVYIDAFVLRDGESVMSLQPVHRVDHYERLVEEKGDGWLVPPNPAEFYGVTVAEERRWIDELSVPQPFDTLRQPLRLRQQGTPGYRRSYVRASGWGPNVFDQFVDRVRGEPDWDYYEVEGGHMLPVSHPDDLARILLGL